ncbi:hypothetical protein FACS189432_06020 [Bacteroidia bacterium]|nr:hypothetical protein FACS189432_06020 [Bacteroidia bacterium]
MKDFTDKISSYNLFNNLLPGIIYAYIVSFLTNMNLIVDNLLWGFFVYYFIGLVISRIGSLIIDPILKKIKFINTELYNDYLNASIKDCKIELFTEINNMYRTIIALLLLVLITKGVHYLVDYYCIQWVHVIILTIALLLTLFLFAYKKQTKYIKKRISIANNKEDK